MSSRRASVFPFTAVVGQDVLKTALLLNAVEPRVGGVLIRGEKGTAKSTAVRALAAVLPEIDVVDGCRFGCDPHDRTAWCPDCLAAYSAEKPAVARRRPRFVDLPISATEDRLVGTLDLEHALKHGERRFEPGLLAAANRGILYVDEVNLLDDHLVDALLDAAAMGTNVVEREGIAFAHPARFILVGTMNPEEGDVRPQLLDRFGLCVEIESLRGAAERVEVVKRRTAYEDDAERFRAAWRSAEEALGKDLVSARRRLPDTALSDDLLFLIASITTEMGVDGHRADIVMSRAAVALAALEGASEVTPAHIRWTAPLVLTHRMRRRPFEDDTFDQRRLDAIAGVGASSDDGAAQQQAPGAPGAGAHDEAMAAVALRLLEADALGVADDGVPALVTTTDGLPRRDPGRRQQTRSDDKRGRYVRSEPAKQGSAPDVALDATIRAAAPHQKSRGGDMAVRIEAEDVQTKVRKRRVGASIVFCVDASGSMSASRRMQATKAAVLELLVDAYRRRDRVGLVSFRGECAEVLLSPTASVELAQLKLRELATGGATPLAHGIMKSLDVLQAETRRDDSSLRWLVLVTDGRANVGIDGGLGSEDARAAATRVRSAKVNSMVIDTDPSRTGIGGAREIARLTGGEYVKLASFDAASVAGAVRERLEAS